MADGTSSSPRSRSAEDSEQGRVWGVTTMNIYGVGGTSRSRRRQSLNETAFHFQWLVDPERGSGFPREEGRVGCMMCVSVCVCVYVCGGDQQRVFGHRWCPERLWLK